MVSNLKKWLTVIVRSVFTWPNTLLLLCLLYVLLSRNIKVLNHFYCHYVYECLARFLTFLSGWFPFPIGDLFVSLAIVGVLFYPIYSHIKGIPLRHIVEKEFRFLLWIYVWFYLAWGLNYFQPNFYYRTAIAPVEYNDSIFCRFVERYIQNLNTSYVAEAVVDKDRVADTIIHHYYLLDKDLGIRKPFRTSMRAKEMLFSSLASKVGVQGSMAPFFCEFTINADVLPLEYPFSFAHELSHVLGITNEAEANFYAYQVCTGSSSRLVRYSGYYGILSYVLRNVYATLGEEKYNFFLSQIRPEILKQKAQDIQYWRSRYSQTIGDIQNYFYDLYLRGHQVEGGIKNYNYVIGLLLSYEQSQLCD